MPQTPTTSRTNWLATMGATLIGFGLLFAPKTHTDRLETLVHDAALPGLRLLHQAKTDVVRMPTDVRELWDERTTDADEDDRPDHARSEEEIARLEQRVRELQSQNAQLQKDLSLARTQTESPFLAESGTPLFVPELIEAKIIAADDVSVAVQRASAQRIVDVGQADGVVPADFVVSSGGQSSPPERVLIDQGRDAALRPDQPVFAGRCVVGKIRQVGRWTSSLLPITDTEFRGRAQLMRQTDRGLIVGSEGILAGDGTAECRLDFIAATEPVAVGDEVYTAVDGTQLPVPMYYGRVTSAHLPEGAPYWDVQVSPAETVQQTASVQVLRMILNPTRTGLPNPASELP